MCSGQKSGDLEWNRALNEASWSQSRQAEDEEERRRGGRGGGGGGERREREIGQETSGMVRKRERKRIERREEWKGRRKDRVQRKREGK